MNHEEIAAYFTNSGRKIPTTWEAMAWTITEIAEVYELLLARSGGWVRNNPDKHPPYSRELLAEELGDAVLMLLVAGFVAGVDPLEALRTKLQPFMNKEDDDDDTTGTADN